VVADKAQTYCPRLEGLVPWFLRNRSCLDTYELLNNSVGFCFSFEPGQNSIKSFATSTWPEKCFFTSSAHGV
jgi:hypothetical protein